VLSVFFVGRYPIWDFFVGHVGHATEAGIPSIPATITSHATFNEHVYASLVRTAAMVCGVLRN
jgi:hypothetical protein